VLFVATALVSRDARAQCASGACPPCTMCRVPPADGMNPPVAAMSALFDQIAAGPDAYGTLGWDFAGQTMVGTGPGQCAAGGVAMTVPVHFPCILLKAIYLTESNWRQFCDSNQTVIAFDCGYGIAQVTTGMRPGETSPFDPDRVAAEPAYNVSVGAAILADKWRATPCVGANDIDVIEDWYFAVWGYNGLAFSNNPNNPMYAADRPEFLTPGIASAQVRSNYPYQEIVWGYAHYPPSADYYTGIGLAYPDRSEICAACGDPTMDISDPVGAHRSTCPNAAPAPDAGATDADTTDAGMTDDVATDGPGAADVPSSIGDHETAMAGTGCGCRTGSRAPRPSAIALVAFAALVALRRRRARCI
jgi:MYXO-CTERM domain-containing protein